MHFATRVNDCLHWTVSSLGRLLVLVPHGVAKSSSPAVFWCVQKYVVRDLNLGK